MNLWFDYLSTMSTMSTWWLAACDWLISTRGFVDEELELDVKRAKYRNFSAFLHYLFAFDRKSWRETWRLFDRESWREVMIGNHDGETWRSFDEKSWRKVMKKSHEEKSWRRVMKRSHDEKSWRLFDFGRKSWRRNMVESHEEKSWRLF